MGKRDFIGEYIRSLDKDVHVHVSPTESKYYKFGKGLIIRVSDHSEKVFNNEIEMNIIRCVNNPKLYVVKLYTSTKNLIMDLKEVKAMIYSKYWDYRVLNEERTIKRIKKTAKKHNTIMTNDALKFFSFLSVKFPVQFGKFSKEKRKFIRNEIFLKQSVRGYDFIKAFNSLEGTESDGDMKKVFLSEKGKNSKDSVHVPD